MSRLFSQSDLREMERRKNGDYKDRFGVFSKSTRPKIREILEVWFPRRKELEKLVKPKR
jgi:hypothetical protein